MFPFRRILIASLVAPAAVAGPLLVIAALSWAFMNPISDGDAPFRLAGLGMFAAVPIYLVLMAVCTVVAVGLQRLGILTYSSLLVTGAVVSFAIAGLLAFPWVRAGNLSQAVQSFFIFFGVGFVASATLVSVWWWLVSNLSLNRDGESRAAR